MIYVIRDTNREMFCNLQNFVELDNFLNYKWCYGNMYMQTQFFKLELLLSKAEWLIDS